MAFTKKVNPRRVVPKQRAIAKRIADELRSAEPGEVEDLSAKLDYLYKVRFHDQGTRGINAVRGWLDERFPVEATLRPTIAALIFSRQFDELDHLLDANAAGPEPLADLPVQRVRSALLQGDVDRAKELIYGALPLVEGKVRDMLIGFGITIGLAPRIAAEFPSEPDERPRLKRALELGPPPRRPVPVICINMDRDTERLARARVLQSEDGVFIRSAGVAGAALPQAFLDKTGLEIAVPRRAQVGCHLGHIKAWEIVANELQPGRYALVTEDDASFIYGPGRGLREALALARSHRLDVLFLQAEPLQLEDSHQPWSSLSALPLDPILRKIVGERIPGWGGEGYLVSTEGARKMLKIAMEIGILGPLDWQIALYGSDDLSITKGRNPERFGVIAERLAAARETHGVEPFRIEARQMSHPLIWQMDLGYTSHNVEVSLTR